MPEGDTVWLAARTMHQALAGQSIVATDFRVPKLATVQLAGQAITAVAARGKHLLMRFDGGSTLHSHLRMDGSWHVYRPGRRWRGGPGWQVRAVISTPDWVAVGYRLPILELIATSSESEVVGHLGPDLMDENSDPAMAIERLAARPTRPIGEALLDQRVVAGIGNLYRCESLFIARISAWTPTRDVSNPLSLLRIAQRLLRLNALTPAQVTTGVSSRQEEHWVYGRQGRPCRRCTTTIRKADQGEPPRQRVVFWCPTCQPGPPSCKDA